MEQNNINDRLDDYKKFSIKYGEGIKSFDSEKANKYHKKLDSLYQEFKAAGILELLKKFLSDEDDFVVINAAVGTLKIDEETAVKALKRIMEKDNMASITASTCLMMWEDNELELL